MGISNACYLGILARIAQADAHHKKLMDAVEERQKAQLVGGLAQAVAVD